jgi:hypothetical protein
VRIFRLFVVCYAKDQNRIVVSHIVVDNDETRTNAGHLLVMAAITVYFFLRTDNRREFRRLGNSVLFLALQPLHILTTPSIELFIMLIHSSTLSNRSNRRSILNLSISTIDDRQSGSERGRCVVIWSALKRTRLKTVYEHAHDSVLFVCLFVFMLSLFHL